MPGFPVDGHISWVISQVMYLNIISLWRYPGWNNNYYFFKYINGTLQWSYWDTKFPDSNMSDVLKWLLMFGFTFILWNSFYAYIFIANIWCMWSGNYSDSNIHTLPWNQKCVTDVLWLLFILSYFKSLHILIIITAHYFYSIRTDQFKHRLLDYFS